MTPDELLKNTSAAEKEVVLKALLAHAFPENDVEGDEEIPGADFVDAFCLQITALKTQAEENKVKLAEVLKQAPEAGSLDDTISDAFQDRAYSLHGNTEAAARFLIVEDGATAEAVLAIARDAGENPLREIPED